MKHKLIIAGILVWLAIAAVLINDRYQAHKTAVAQQISAAQRAEAANDQRNMAFKESAYQAQNARIKKECQKSQTYYRALTTAQKQNLGVTSPDCNFSALHY